MESINLLNLFEPDLNEREPGNLPEDLRYSEEDRKFMTIVSNGVCYTEGYYNISLPFRQEDVKSPNNQKQAVKIVLWQKTKIMENGKHRNDHVAFIIDMVKDTQRKCPKIITEN